MKILEIRKLLPLFLSVPAVLVLPGCFSTSQEDPYAWEENAFLEARPPAYGYGGGSAPSAGRPYDGGRTLSPGDYSQSRGGTMYLNPRPTNNAPPVQPQTQPPANTEGGWVPFWQRRGDSGGVSSSGSQGAGRGGNASGAARTEPTPAVTSGSPPPVINPPSLTEGEGAAPRVAVPKPNASGHPYGVTVPGKYGYVYSPHDSEKRYVDVTDIPSGTEVRCPYTKKIFLVP